MVMFLHKCICAEVHSSAKEEHIWLCGKLLPDICRSVAVAVANENASCSVLRTPCSAFHIHIPVHVHDFDKNAGHQGPLSCASSAPPSNAKRQSH